MDILTLSYPAPEDSPKIFSLTQMNNDDYILDFSNMNRTSKVFYDTYTSRIFKAIESDPKRYIIAKVKNEIVWFLKYNTKYDESKPYSFDDKFELELFQLFVDPEYHKKWIWRQLMKKMISDNLENCQNIYLFTWMVNHRAINFYQKIWLQKAWSYDDWEIWSHRQQKMTWSISQIYQNLQNYNI